MSVGRFEPYDFWIACQEQDIRIRDNNILDYSDYISFNGDRYTIKAIVREFFGQLPIIHAFLNKETS